MSFADIYLNGATKSLVDFFASATSVADTEVFKAQQECTLARYALKDKINLYCTFKKALQEKAEDGDISVLPQLAKLDKMAEQLISTVDKVVKTLKVAAEIEVLSNTKFDGVQLFHIVQQIPIILSATITAVLTSALELFAEDIFSCVEGDEELKVHLNGQMKKLRGDVRREIPVLAASVAKEICDKLSSQLNEQVSVINVKHIDKSGRLNLNSSEGSSHGGVTEEQVKAMIESVPQAVPQDDSDNNSIE